jgi:hypothetical protein
MTQAEDCMRLEEERVENYLHASTKTKPLHHRSRAPCNACYFVTLML